MFLLLVLFASYIVLNVLDVYLTDQIITKGKGYEKNKLLRWYMDKCTALVTTMRRKQIIFGLGTDVERVGRLLAMISGKVLATIAILICVIFLPDRGTLALLFVYVAVYFFVVWNNYSILNKK